MFLKGGRGSFLLMGTGGSMSCLKGEDGDPFMSFKGGGEYMHVFKGGMVIH